MLRRGCLEPFRRARPQGLDGSAESIVGSGIFPFGQHAAPGVAVRHKPGERSALRVCDRSVSVGNEVDDRGAQGGVSRLLTAEFDKTMVRPGAARKTVQLCCIRFFCCGGEELSS